LNELSLLFGAVGNYAEEKRLLVHTLTLEREQGDDYWVAQTLRQLSRVNLNLGLYGEGIPQAEEAVEILKRLGNTMGEANFLEQLARALLYNGQPDAAKDAALRMIKLLPEKGEEFLLCQSHDLLGGIYHSKGEKEKSIHHYEAAISIASPFNWQHDLFWTHWAMAQLFRGQGELNNANAYIKQAKSYTADDAYNLGRGMELQAKIWYRQCRLEEAKLETLDTLEIFERLGAANGAGRCRGFLQAIEAAMGSQLSGNSDSGGEFFSHSNVPHSC
jgi:tetratricopeptide (TPR) repeat protein